MRRRSDEGIFLGYSSDKKAYRVYNRRTLVIEEVVHVTFDEANDVISKDFCEDEDVGVQKKLEKLTIQEEHQETKESNEDDAHHLDEEGERKEDSPKNLPKARRFVSSHP
ncbi:hypothetical protein ACH5RR_023146 [Cinchona calisaya]|uniref:Retroviral polymerase SH3-like domain-containing protein n=1 Tax=Cinchona calisaya TaxID=153742 RepID=A0ABD2ZAX9_9GENT